MSSNSDNRSLSQAEPVREYPPRPTIAPRERDDLYYTLLAGAAKTKLLESWYDLRLPALLAERGPLTAAEIGDSLGLHLKRAGKWLVLLARIGLVEQQQGRFRNSEAGIAMFWAKDGRENYFMKDQMEYCRWVNALDFEQFMAMRRCSSACYDSYVLLFIVFLPQIPLPLIPSREGDGKKASGRPSPPLTLISWPVEIARDRRGPRKTAR